MPKLMTIKEIAQKTGISEYAVKTNIERLLPLLPIKKRVAVMEYMLYCKQLKHRKSEEEVMEVVESVGFG